MPISVKCDFCGKALRVRDEMAGKKIKCTDCGAHVDVPGGRSSGGGGRSKADDDDDEFTVKPSSPRRRSRDDDEEERRPASRRRKSRNNSGLMLIGGIAGGFLLLCICSGLASYGLMSPPKAQPPVVGVQSPPFVPVQPNPPQFNQPQFNQPRFQPMQPLNPGNNQNNQNNAPRFQPPPQEDVKPTFKPAGGGEDLPLVKAVDWKGQPDPQENPPVLTFDKPLTLNLSHLPEGALFPQSPSVFVAFGNNGVGASRREIWNLSTGKKTSSVIAGVTLGDLCALSADGRYFTATVFAKPTDAVVYDLKTNKNMGTVSLGKEWIKYLGFGGSKRIIVASGDRIASWQLSPQKEEKVISIDGGVWNPEKNLCISHGGNYAASLSQGFNDSSITVFSLDTREAVGQLNIPKEDHGKPDLIGMQFSPDGKELGAMFMHWDKGTFITWSMDSGDMTRNFVIDNVGKELGSWRTFKGVGLQFLPNGKRVLACGEVVVDLDEQQVLYKVPGVGEFASNFVTNVLANGHLAVARPQGFRKPMTFTTIPLSEETFKAASEVVAKGGTALDASLPTLTATNWTDVRKSAMQGAAPAWQVADDPCAPPKPKFMPGPLNLADRPVRLVNAALSGADAGRLVVQYGKEAGFFAADIVRVEGGGNRSTVRPGSKKAAAAKSNEHPDTPAFLDVYDLVSGKITSTVPITFDCHLTSASPDGKFALVRIVGKKDRLDVYEVDTGKHVVGWRPYQDEEKDNEKEIEAAVFIDSTHVLTKNHWGDTVVMWELPSCKAIYEIDEVAVAGLSPGRKYVVAAHKTGKDLRFFDALTGEAKGSLETPGNVKAAAFHPDGQLLGAVISEGPSTWFMSWKMSDGMVDKEFPVPSIARTLEWCGRTNVLINNSELIDLPGKTVVWKYNTQGLALTIPGAPDARHWYLGQRFGRNNNVVLNAVTLPDNAAQQTILSADLKPDYVIAPGSTVSVAVNLGVAPPNMTNFANEVATKFTEMLQNNGCQVGAGAPVVVNITSAQGQVKPEEVVEIREFGNINTTKVKVERVTYNVTITRNGTKAWESGGTISNAGFGILHKQPNVTWEQQLRNDLWGSFTNSLKNFQLPKYVIGNANGFGTSNFTADGVQK